MHRLVLQANLKKYATKDICVEFALKCVDSVLHYNDHPELAIMRSLINEYKSNPSVALAKNIRASLDKVATIRVNHSDSAKESAHAMLHAAEAVIAATQISASGHAARSAEAAFKADKNVEQICMKYLVDNIGEQSWLS